MFFNCIVRKKKKKNEFNTNFDIFFFFKNRKHETQDIAPIEHLVFICDGAYSKQEILSMEEDICTTLRFKFRVCNVLTFVNEFWQLLKPFRSYRNSKIFDRARFLTHV